VQRTNERLSAVILKRLKDEIGKRTIQQVVSGDRAEIMVELATSAKQQADELGIEIIDARIKRVDLPEDVSQSVFDRMGAERKKVAKKFRSEGEERAKEIRAEADREREVILAEAERDAQKIRGDGDARATETYANAFSQDMEFYSFYRSLDAYRNTFNNSADVLLLEPDSQFFRYFKDAQGKR
jgi:membrane protease subunit HflC